MSCSRLAWRNSRMVTKTKRPKAPQTRPRAVTRRPPLSVYLAAAGIVILATAIAVLASRGSESPSASAGLPNTSDYHSLLVDPTNPDRLLLGTHGGLYRSVDGGRHWQFFQLRD